METIKQHEYHFPKKSQQSQDYQQVFNDEQSLEQDIFDLKDYGYDDFKEQQDKILSKVDKINRAANDQIIFRKLKSMKDYQFNIFDKKNEFHQQQKTSEVQFIKYEDEEDSGEEFDVDHLFGEFRAMKISSKSKLQFLYKHGLRKPIFSDSKVDVMANKLFDQIRNQWDGKKALQFTGIMDLQDKDKGPKAELNTLLKPIIDAAKGQQQELDKFTSQVQEAYQQCYEKQAKEGLLKQAEDALKAKDIDKMKKAISSLANIGSYTPQNEVWGSPFNDQKKIQQEVTEQLNMLISDANENISNVIDKFINVFKPEPKKNLEKDAESYFNDATIPNFCYLTNDIDVTCEPKKKKDKLVHYEINLAGRCEETCFESKDNKKGQLIPKCQIITGVVFEKWCGLSEVSLKPGDCEYTIFQSSWHVQDNYSADDQKFCKQNFQIGKKFGFLPVCQLKTKVECEDMGYLKCTAFLGINLGCGTSQKSCDDNIADMQKALYTGMTKFIGNVLIPGSSFFMDLALMVENIYNSAKAFFEMVIVKLKLIKQQKDFSQTLLNTQYNKAAKNLFKFYQDNNILDGATFEQLKESISSKHKKTLDSIKNAGDKFNKLYTHVTGCDDKDKCSQGDSPYQSSIMKQLDEMKQIAKTKVDEIIEQGQQAIEKIQDEIKDSVESVKEGAVELIGDIEQDLQALLVELVGQDALGSISKTINGVLSLQKVIASGSKDQKSAAYINMAKSALQFASKFDPTGFSNIAQAFIKDSCPIFESDKHLVQ